jgi:predicted Zn-dependent protease
MPAAFAIIYVALLPGAAWAQSGPADEGAARDLVTAGKIDEGIALYERLVRASPDNPRMLVNLSIAEFKGKRFESAAQHAEAALRLAPGMAAANLFAGASYLELGKPRDAVQRLQQFLTAVPTDRNGRLMLAEALLGSEQYEQALEQFRTTAEMLPASPRVWYGLGRTYDALAERALSELDRNAPDSAFRHVLAGDSYVEQERYGSAFVAYTKALVRKPLVPGIRAGLARVYRETGHPELVKREEALERDAVSPEGLKQPGAAEFLAYRSYRQLSSDSYNRLRSLPPSVEAHIYAAREFDARGRYVQSAVEWRKVLDIAPERTDVLQALAWALYRSRDYESVLPLMSARLKTDPDSREANFLYGASLVNMERPREAIRPLERALGADAEFRPAHAALGQALLRTGEAEKAIPHLKAAAAADDNGSLRFQLFRAYEQTGQTEAAKEALAEYQRFRTSLDAEKKFEQGATVQISTP